MEFSLDGHPIYDSVCRDLGYMPVATRIALLQDVKRDLIHYWYFYPQVMDPKKAIVISAL